jgi:hypothetical protein
LQRQAVLMMLPWDACALAGHAEQVALPAASLYVSGGHTAHGPPLGPEKPGTHEQFSAWVEAASEVALAGHASQLALPGLDLKEPAAHAAHAPGAPLKPGAHLQAVRDVLAGPEIAFRGHSVHSNPQLFPGPAPHPWTSTSQSVKHAMAGSAKYMCLP